MITATKLPNGDLKLSASNACRAWLAESMASKHYNFWSTLADGLESYWTNGSYQPFDAGDGNPFVGLTSAPCIAETMNFEDDGTQTIDGDFWYFDRYVIDCPLEQLRNFGRAVFTLARESES